jgi:ubiquinone/menaquinone biosynthesis C-methylase UbiE
MGHRITALDINEDSLRLTALRLGRLSEQASFVNQDMVDFASKTTSRFDVIIFNASFHHCHKHLEMIKNLRRILNPGGKFALTPNRFAGPPIPFSPIRGDSGWMANPCT